MNFAQAKAKVERDRAMTKAARRVAMPFTTAFIDDMRSAFGELKGIHASENGHSVAWGERVMGYEVVPKPELKRKPK